MQASKIFLFITTIIIGLYHPAFGNQLDRQLDNQLISQQSASSATVITLTIPKAVLQDAVNHALPITIMQQNKHFSGIINLTKISQLSLAKNHISCRLNLKGEDMAITSSFGKHDFTMKIKDTSVDFSINAKIEFDAAKQLLLLTPEFNNLQTTRQSEQSPTSSIADLILQALNRKTFPLTIKQLKPLTARIAPNSELLIKMHLHNIDITANNLNLKFTPRYEKKHTP
jgi:hypothetical protein